MPSRSQAQHGAMCAAAHGKGKKSIPQSVGKEFCEADKGRDVKKLPKRLGNRTTRWS